MEKEIKKNTPRDVFLHLLSVVTLYWSSIVFITLLWQYINYFFPDAINYYYQGDISGTVRFAVSSLIVVFPVFILVSWYLNKIYRKESEVRESKLRKWLIYLTLFVSSLVIIGDLVKTINMFLEGSTTTAFVLKALSVFLVAVAIFGYYLDDVRRAAPTKSAKYFAWISAVMVLGAIIGAFFIVSSPIDQKKILDLQGIQNQIVNYWQSKEKLPASLSDLNDTISGYAVPSDPQTKDKGYSYEYIIKDEAGLSFELCAIFNKSSRQISAKTTYLSNEAGLSQNWNHSLGRFCFERKIDKDLYQPFKK